MARSLLGQGHPLAVLSRQHEVLRPEGRFRPFEDALADSDLAPLMATGLEIFQMNLGRMCNQTCKHCHVDAGPDRTEIMTRETMEDCLAALASTAIPRVDLTGGAPEMNPHFRWLVAELRALGRHVMDRCNLTILTVGGFRDLPEFLAEHRVEVIASLPYFLARNTDAQRGAGVFEKSIEAIRRLNELGYGREGSGLVLNLAYNPTGAFLAPKQASVEPEYRRELERRHGVVFNELLVLSNMPINRFLEYLLRTEQYEEYMRRLIDAYNPAAAGGVMCRTTLSVGWDGRLFDCDFNQMLDLGLAPDQPGHISAFDPERLARRRIVTALHCYGCTAGQGSSCGGAVVKDDARSE
jgi:radical SAM/Cys-rich protein